MKTYLVDTNVFLRFFLKDHSTHFAKAKKYFSQAKAGKIKLILVPQIVFEINYVLKKVYSQKNIKIANLLIDTVSSPYIQTQDQKVLIDSLNTYKKINIDLVDIYLYQLSKHQKAQVLSFDKDFNKLL